MIRYQLTTPHKNPRARAAGNEHAPIETARRENTTTGKRVALTQTPYSTPESAALTQVGEMWVGSRYHFYADEDTTFVDEETGETVDINSDDIEDNFTVGATITMCDRYTPVTVTRIDERSYKINGRETDHCGAPYDAQDALDFIFKWYGATTRHTIARP